MKPLAKTVLITGASTGIGEATAKLFLDRGWNVVATMRRPEAAGGWSESPACVVTRLDVTDEASIQSAFEQALERFGHLDVVVNNAGYGLAGPLEGLSPEQLKRQFDTNVLGLIAVSQRALGHMRPRSSGVIINISSIGGRMAFPLNSAYHATKFAVEGLSESLRLEVAPHGVRVKVVEPGGIKTDFISRSLEMAEHPAYKDQLAALRALTERLNERMPGPEGVATVIYRAATDGSPRLRYLAKPGPYLAMNRLLPDPIWRLMIGQMLGRPKATQPKAAGA